MRVLYVRALKIPEEQWSLRLRVFSVNKKWSGVPHILTRQSGTRYRSRYIWQSGYRLARYPEVQRSGLGAMPD